MSDTGLSHEAWQSPEALQPNARQRITVVLKELPNKTFEAVFLPNHGRSHRVLFHKPVPKRSTYGGNYRFWWQVKQWRAATSVPARRKPVSQEL